MKDNWNGYAGGSIGSTRLPTSCNEACEFSPASSLRSRRAAAAAAAAQLSKMTPFDVERFRDLVSDFLQ